MAPEALFQVIYQVLFPSAADELDPQAGSFEVYAAAEDGKLRLSDITEAWPFAGSFLFRAQLRPPSETPVYFDLVGPSALVPALPDGTVVLRALPLHALPAVSEKVESRDAERWAWRQADFFAWSLAREKRLLDIEASESVVAAASDEFVDDSDAASKTMEERLAATTAAAKEAMSAAGSALRGFAKGMFQKVADSVRR
jgi:hypothetical protein